MDERGEITDEDRDARRGALRPARGRGPRGLHLLRRPAAAAGPPPRPGLHRHRLLRRERRRSTCSELRERLGLELGERERRRRGLAGRDRLPRLLPLLPGGADRRHGRRRPRRGRAGRLAGSEAAAEEPAWQSTLPEPVLLRPGDYSGLRRARERDDPGRAARGGRRRPTSAAAAAPASRPGRSGSSRPRPPGEEKFIVANGDEGDPGSYIDKYLMERNPALLIEGMALAGLRGRRRPRLRPHPLGVPALEAAARGRRRRARERAGRASERLRRHRSRGRRLLRGRRGDRAARLPRRACAGPSRRARRSPPSAASSGCRRSSTTSRPSATSPSSPPAAPPPTRELSPGRDAGLEARLLQRALRPARRLRGPLRHAGARALRGARRRPRRRPRDQGACRSAARSAGSCPAHLLDTPFDFDQLAEQGCMVGHGSIVAFDDRTDMRDLATHLLRFGADESCGKCFPCRIGLRRAHEAFAADEPVDRERARGPARGARGRQPLRPRRRHARPDAQPARPLPRGAGARVSAVTVDGQPAEVESRRDRARGGAGRRRDRADPLLRRAPGALRRLPGLPGRASTAPIAPGLHDAVPRRDGDRDRRRARAPGRQRASSSSSSPSCPSRPRRTPSSPRSPAQLEVGEPRWRGATHERRHDTAPPLPRLPPRALHLLRALRARLRRGPGDLRADRHRARLRRQHRRRARPRASANRPASPAAPAPTPVRPTRSPSRLCSRRLIQMSDERFDTTVTTTCGYCGVGCSLEATGRRRADRLDRPRADGPANHGHTCLKGRFAHRFSRHRERLTTPLIREDGELREASWEEAIERIVAELGRIKADARPRRDRRPRLLARHQRGLLRDAAPDARRDRHQQHRQLLARLPLADLLRAAPVVRPLGRDRLLRRHRPRRRGDPDRRQPDRRATPSSARASSRRRCAAAGW